MNRLAEGEMTNEQMNRNSDGLTEEANGKMDRQTYGQMKRWTKGQMD